MCDAAHAHSSPRTHEKLARSKREELTFTAHARPRARLKRDSSPNAAVREKVCTGEITEKRIRGLQIAAESVFYVLISTRFQHLIDRDVSDVARTPVPRSAAPRRRRGRRCVLR